MAAVAIAIVIAIARRAVMDDLLHPDSESLVSHHPIRSSYEFRSLLCRGVRSSRVGYY
jgi:hypothetical protein